MVNPVVGVIMQRVNIISSMSVKEIADLRSTLHALTNKEFLCSSCKSKYRGRKDFAEMTKKQQKLKGCHGISDRVIHTLIQDKTKLEYSTCIGNFFNYSALKWIGFYNHFENGTMPFEGGYMDQPSKVIDIMGVVAEHKIDQIKSEANKQRVSNRNNVRQLRG